MSIALLVLATGFSPQLQGHARSHAVVRFPEVRMADTLELAALSNRRSLLPFSTLASNSGARAAQRGERPDVAASYAGCVPPPIDISGLALLVLANVVIYNGYKTETNAAEAEDLKVPAVSVQRRKFAVLVALQAGIALFRRGSGKVCSVEEIKELNALRLE